MSKHYSMSFKTNKNHLLNYLQNYKDKSVLNHIEEIENTEIVNPLFFISEVSSKILTF